MLPKSLRIADRRFQMNVKAIFNFEILQVSEVILTIVKFGYVYFSIIIFLVVLFKLVFTFLKGIYKSQFHKFGQGPYNRLCLFLNGTRSLPHIFSTWSKSSLN